MTDNTKREIRWPDGWSASIPLRPFPVGISGTYYSNPGSPTAPPVTVTGSLGFGTSGQGIHRVFLRKGMTSEDTLGYGASGNLSSIVPSLTVNASIPDENLIPQPWKAKVSSIEAGAATPGASAAITYTWTPQQISDFLLSHGLIGAARLGSTLHREALAEPHSPMHVISPAMGPIDELSPFARALRSGVGTVGARSSPPVGYLSSRRQNPFGDEMGDWRSSVDPIDTPRQAPAGAAPPRLDPGGSPPSSDVFTNGAPPIPFFPLASQRVPSGLPAMLAEMGAFDSPSGGLPALMQEYLRNH